MFLDKKTLLKIWLTPGLNLTMFRVTGPRNTSSRNPDSHLRLESRIQVPMTNEMKYYKKVPMRKTGIQYTWNPESTAWNPESKTVMDSLARGETNGQKIQYIFTGSFTSSPRVSHVMSHVSMFFFWTKPSWLCFFIFNLLDNHGASNPGYLAIQNLCKLQETEMLQRNACYWVSFSQKGTRSSFEKFCQKRDVSHEELEKHFRLEIVRPKNSATSSLNSPSRTLVETNFLSIVN